jgi:hypothetical protein
MKRMREGKGDEERRRVTNQNIRDDKDHTSAGCIKKCSDVCQVSCCKCSAVGRR